MAITLCNPFRVDVSVSVLPRVALHVCAVPLTLGYVVRTPLGSDAPYPRLLLEAFLICLNRSLARVWRAGAVRHLSQAWERSPRSGG